MARGHEGGARCGPQCWGCRQGWGGTHKGPASPSPVVDLGDAYGHTRSTLEVHLELLESVLLRDAELSVTREGRILLADIREELRKWGKTGKRGG